jgi:hypothetical protein
VKRTVARHRPGGKSRPEPDAPASCKYKKVQLPNVRPGEIDVDALIRSLETRNAPKHASQAAPQAMEPAKKVVPGAAPSAGDGALPENNKRMSDEDLQEISRVLKTSRSVASARQWGLRLLAETRRAREAEKRLASKA